MCFSSANISPYLGIHSRSFSDTLPIFIVRLAPATARVFVFATHIELPAAKLHAGGCVAIVQTGINYDIQSSKPDVAPPGAFFVPESNPPN